MAYFHGTLRSQLSLQQCPVACKRQQQCAAPLWGHMGCIALQQIGTQQLLATPHRKTRLWKEG